MKRFLPISLILYSSLIYSQNNTVTLGNFDNFTGNCQIGQQVDPHPFVHSPCNTKGWYALPGTPHLVNNQVSNSSTFIQTYDAAPDNIQSLSGEGIFREYDFNFGETYLLSFRFYRRTTMRGVRIYLRDNYRNGTENNLDELVGFYQTIKDEN